MVRKWVILWWYKGNRRPSLLEEEEGLAVMERGYQSGVDIKTTFSTFLILLEARSLCLTRNGKSSVFLCRLNKIVTVLVSMDNLARRKMKE